ncbi:unnamed protein product [Thlaspi arvense]|uniref:ubiquitinyl hydrolase 1 n=1 Tax=Thlaspi arvense TaxID=13288 RepID=A0AAU9RIZ7_THLAR|nr:unnamed protein product [Thlaspi arvense]
MGELMGKKAKKKARASTNENLSTTLSKKVSEQPSEAGEVAEGAVQAVKEKQVCVHFDKGLNLDKVLDKIKSSRQIKCQECKEGVHDKRGAKAKGGNKGKHGFTSSDPKSDKKAIWVCLECGCYVCGGVGLPTGPQSHVVRHIRLTRHRLVIQWENPQLRWCFPCQSLLPVEKEENGEKKDVLSEVVNLMKGRSLKNLPSPDTEEQSSASGSITSDIKLEGSVTSGIEARDGCVVRGLVNLGNTCFFNSIMQNLLSLDQLRDHFLKEDISGVGGPLASSLKKLFAETRPEAGLKSVMNPRAFFGSFCTKAPQFRGYDQHDSHELLRCLLDSLSTEESALRKRRGASDNDQKSTLIDSVFGGETSSIVSCIECGHSSKVYEPFLDLSLPVPFKKTPPKKQQIVSRVKKPKLPPKRVPKNAAKVSKVSKVLPTKALSEVNSPVKSAVVTADSDASCSSFPPIDNGAVSETPSVITVDNNQASESVTQSDTAFDSFWLDVIGPETSGDETNWDMEDAVSDTFPATEANQIVPGSNIPANTSVPLGDQSLEGNDIPANTSVSLGDQSLEGKAETLMQDNDESAKAETILDEKDVQATQSDECTATSGISAEINQVSCIGGDPGIGESSSSVNPWDEEELPLVVADSQVLYMPYKENISYDDKTVVEGEGEASSSFVTGDHEPQNHDFVDFGGLFDEPETTEGPVFGPPSKAEASGVGFMAFSSESDPEEIDDSDSPVSVERCLAHFTKPETLSDDNAWNCENCSKNLKLQRLRENKKSKNDESRSSNTSNGWVSSNEEGVSGETVVSAIEQDPSDSFNVKDDGMGSNSAHDSESEDEEAVDDSEKLVTVKRDATKRVLVNKAPPVLTIHLKRFSQDLRGRLSKLNGHVAFKEFLDLRQYMDSRCNGEDPPVYRLAGLVEHSGTMRGGHYVAYVRGGQRAKDTDSSEPETTEPAVETIEPTPTSSSLPKQATTDLPPLKGKTSESLKPSVSLKCGDCGALLKSVEEAQEHAEITSHSNFAESTEAVLNLVCTICSKPCRSKTESDLHTKRTGHTEFVDKTMETVKPISLEAPRVAMDIDNPDGSSASGEAAEEMVVPDVDKTILEELEGMGFPKARATRALHYSGNASLEAAVNWVVEHENDPDVDEMPKVPANSNVGPPKPALTPEEVKIKAQELRERARKKKEEEEKRMEREREKERIRIGKELLEAKRMEEDNERKRIIALRKAEKEEERRAREKIRQKVEEDKAERRRKLGLPPEDPATAKPSVPVVEEKKSSLPIRPATKTEQMRECLRSLKQTHKEDDAKVKKAFETLLTYMGNVAKNPDEEKFRKIRLTNQTFQERVGSLRGGIEFLELCGFEKIEGGEFLFLPRDKIDSAIINSAGTELNSAITNPFFGVL